MLRLRDRLWKLRCRLQLKARAVKISRNYRSLVRRNWIIRRYLSLHDIRKVQIGAGQNKLADWLNTDLMADDEIVYLDATRTLPFPDSSIDYIFSEHMFEHIPYRDGVRLLQEAFRVLKPRGRIRISTPDLTFLIRLYTEPDAAVMKRYIRNSVDTYVSEPKLYERGVVVNNFFYNWGHQFIYDMATISHSLALAGFTDIRRFRPMESFDPILRNLEAHGQVIGSEFNLLESMAIEARKP